MSDRIQEIKERLAKATPGPWSMETHKTSCGLCYRIIPTRACIYADDSDWQENKNKLKVLLYNIHKIMSTPSMPLSAGSMGVDFSVAAQDWETKTKITLEGEERN